MLNDEWTINEKCSISGCLRKFNQLNGNDANHLMNIKLILIFNLF